MIGAYFNPQKLEIHEYILLIPSEEVVKARAVRTKIGERYRVMNYLSPDSKGKWAKYLIRKTDLASKLMEKFEEMGKYIK